jgi:hypothetical protein
MPIEKDCKNCLHLFENGEVCMFAPLSPKKEPKGVIFRSWCDSWEPRSQLVRSRGEKENCGGMGLNSDK